MAQGGPQNKNNEIKPIKVVIVKGAAEVTIKVSDEGGGIPRSVMARIFKFTHSTSRQETEGDTDFGTVEAGIRQMRGFGLPLARIYARYFGGELTLKSMEGHGLDAYLYLPRLGDACENLPRRVVHSPGEQVSLPSARWSKEKNPLSRSYSTTTPLKRVHVSPEARLLEEAYKLKQSTDDEYDQPGWEEAKIRRILKILESRAL
jgi:Histidine kinase-, DNA gyrase B-, and HSP90-like ATPase